jgi:DNA-binding NarL/FixJ family response regulator
VKNIRIAIFEDNEKFRDSLEYLIVTTKDMELQGCFDDTNRILEKMEVLQPDVVLMDINIPVVNGIEATAAIKSKFPHIQVCIQTVFEEDDKVFASLCAGASGYILKNSPPDRILQAIREVADGGLFFTPSIAKKVLFNFSQQSSKPEFIQLTDKEKEILKLLVDGLSYKMIADHTGLSIHTIHTHIRHIYEKLHVNSNSQAVAKAIKQKLI